MNVGCPNPAGGPIPIPDLRPEWRRFGVSKAWLFGSRSRGDASADSDWDFLVRFEQPVTFERFMGLKEALEEKFGHPIDLVSESGCAARFLDAIRDELVDATQS